MKTTLLIPLSTVFFIGKSAKKIFNTKFTFILMENYQKSQQVDSLIKTRNALKQEIQNKEKKSVRL
jgi:hypothetical protein